LINKTTWSSSSTIGKITAGTTGTSPDSTLFGWFHNHMKSIEEKMSRERSEYISNSYTTCNTNEETKDTKDNTNNGTCGKTYSIDHMQPQSNR
jgi:hypothetical protein